MEKNEIKELSTIAIWDRFFGEDLFKKLQAFNWKLEDNREGMFLIKPSDWKVIVHDGMENTYIKNKYNPIYKFYHHERLMYEAHAYVMRSSTSYTLYDFFITQ